MEDSSDDDFIDLPSTHARVKRKEWPDQDDLGGMSSKKVGGGTGRTPQKKYSEEMTREEKKKKQPELDRLDQGLRRKKTCQMSNTQLKGRRIVKMWQNIVPKWLMGEEQKSEDHIDYQSLNRKKP